jgi:hypothetical protein
MNVTTPQQLSDETIMSLAPYIGHTGNRKQRRAKVSTARLAAKRGKTS